MSIATMVGDAAEAFFELAGVGRPFSLADLDRFPLTEWLRQRDIYSVLEQWYNGEPLSVTTTDPVTGRLVEKYPIKINPIKGTCQKHATTVVGSNVDSIRFGGLPFQLIPDVKPELKETGEKIQDALRKVFQDNAFGASFLTNVLTSQYLGGSVLAAKYLPHEESVEITTPSVKEFIGIPQGNNYFRLREGWIVRKITKQDAEDLGYKPKQNEEAFYYIEYWSRSNYKIMVNGKVIRFPDTNEPQEGENVFGVVPIVYVPHIRTDGFLGDTVITETVKGLIRELNLRWSDVGDAVNDDAHGWVAIRNVSGAAKTVNLGDGRPVIDLGSNISLGTTKADPDLFTVRTQSTSEPMLKLGEELYKIYRRETNHPAVADGEDEGSQRSSLTLATRMAPLVGEAELERIFLTVGMSEFARILLIIMAEKSLYNITQDMVDTAFIMQWQAMLPRDREALVNEAAVRSKNKLGSNEHLMTLFGDIQNPEEEMEKIKREAKELAPLMQTGFGGSGGNGTGPNNAGSTPRRTTPS